MTLLYCRECGENKPNTEFSVNKSNRTGHRYECKPCNAKKRRSRYHEHGDYYIKALVQNAKNRAIRRGIPFDITADDITFPDVCPVLGIPLSTQEGSRLGNSPSLDRIVPTRGYVKGNVLVISDRANRIKNDATVEELEAVARFYKGLLT